MALELKQSLRLSQQLVITPQLQQAIKLLQLSRMELQTLIQKEITENPILEELEADSQEEAAPESHSEEVEAAKDQHQHEDRVDEVGSKDGEMKEPNDFDWENYLGIYNSPWPTAQPPPSVEDGPSFENTVGGTESLQEHLMWQLHLSAWPDAELRIGQEIIGNVTDEGYLGATIEEIAAKSDAEAPAVAACLAKVQQFDPPGVASRSLQECLAIQARQLGGDEAPLLLHIIEEHLHDLERHNYVAIAKKLKIPHTLARHLADLIHTMEPKPGRAFGGENTQYITPDVYVVKLADDYEVFLNEDGLPRLQISNFYRQALQKGSTVQQETKEYLQNKLRSALWLIKSIHQRQRTLYKVTQSIVKNQRAFLDKGIDHLHPMILRDVAEDIEMHESTVSRVTTNKYVHTPRGIFELKFFFNSGVPKSGGDDVASETVKQRIQQLVHSEDPRKPLSDQTIVKMLAGESIMLARRTVAKYREHLTIPPSSKRRRME